MDCPVSCGGYCDGQRAERPAPPGTVVADDQGVPSHPRFSRTAAAQQLGAAFTPGEPVLVR